MSAQDHDRVAALFASMWARLGGDEAAVERLRVTGDQSLFAPFPVTDIATALYATAAAATSELVEAAGSPAPGFSVDRVLASAWCHHAETQTLRAQPRGTPFTGISREFESRDGRWLRFQAVYAHPRARILKALGVADDPDEVERMLKQHDADEIEKVITDEGGTVAASRTIEEWASHPQGQAVALEPLVDAWETKIAPSTWEPTPGRPLAGIKVLDMTRVLAGPTATQFLAGLGAEVLRIEAPDGDEVGGAGHLGKRWAILDAKTDEGRERLLALLAEADVFVHGYRPTALEGLGLGPEVRASTRPGLVEVTLDAYGWTGPWKERRGFDTLVQFSAGLANAVQAWALKDPEHRTPIDAVGVLSDASRPRLLPIQILDYGAGYLMAAAVLRGLAQRLRTGAGSVSRTSLARVAHEVIETGQEEATTNPITFPFERGPFEDRIFTTSRGPIRRLVFPVSVEGSPIFWERSPDPAGTSNPVWSTASGV